MDNQSGTTQNGDNSQSSSPVQISPPINTPAAEPATAQQLQKVEQQMSGFERATLSWAKAAVIISCIAAVFVCAQWWEMHAGGKDTNALAEAAKKQAEKADTISESMKQAVQQLTATATATQKQVGAAQDSVKAIQRQMRQDQRAWLTPTCETKATLRDGQPIGQLCYYTNTGKTPAKRIKAQFMMKIVREDDVGMFDYPKKVVTRSDVNALFPPQREPLGIYLYVPDRYPEQVLYTDPTKTLFLNGTIMFMVYGEITYNDIFGIRHWIHYCTTTYAPITHLTKPRISKACSDYNDTDDQ